MSLSLQENCCYPFFGAPYSGGGTHIRPSQFLTKGNSLTTGNGLYRLSFQTDGNLVLYRNADNVGIWASRTNNKPANYLYFQHDGNLVLYQNTSGGVQWATNIYSSSTNPPASNAFYILQLDGNFVMGYPREVYLNDQQNPDYPNSPTSIKNFYLIGETATANGAVSPHFGRIK